MMESFVKHLYVYQNYYMYILNVFHCSYKQTEVLDSEINKSLLLLIIKIQISMDVYDTDNIKTEFENYFTQLV